MLLVGLEKCLVLAAATHRWVSSQDLAKLYVDHDQTYKVLMKYFDEVFILQTCHRVEYYVYSNRTIGSNEIRDVLSEVYSASPGLVSFFKIFRGRDVIEHILRVAAGLDSVILGETDVLGQVETAYQKATQQGALKSVLRCLIEYAIRFGKYVRSTTGIARGVTGFGSLTVRFLKKLYGSLENVKILVVGAGEMGSSIVKELKDEGAKNVIILNRTLERARELAEKYGYTYDSLTVSNLLKYLEQVDVALFAISAGEPIVTREHIRGLRRKPLIVDLGVPPNVDAQGETAVINLEDLCKLAEKYNREKIEEAKKVEAILKNEIEKVLDMLNLKFLSNMIGVYMRFTEEIKRIEIEKAITKKLIDSKTAQNIDIVISSVIKKTLRPLLKTIQDMARENPVEAYSFLRRLLASLSEEFSDVMRKVAADQ